MRMSFHFYNPTRIVFGSGTLNELGNQALPGKKALLLMSCGKSAKVSGAYDRTLERRAWKWPNLPRSWKIP
jgi:alcohol dehydrogenase